MDTLSSSRTALRDFAVDVIKRGENIPLRNPDVGGSQPEHEMIVLGLPASNHPTLGHLVREARQLDDKENGEAEKHIVIFSSINLLFQCLVAKEKFHSKIMANMDSTHGGDSGGGKLLSFGVTSMKSRDGRGSNYSRGYTRSSSLSILERVVSLL
jgi:hypothetical protein